MATDTAPGDTGEANATGGAGSGYKALAEFRDELFDQTARRVRARRRCIESLEQLGRDGLAEAGRRRDAIFLQQGITFETTGEEGPRVSGPFPLDLVPRVLTGSEWTRRQARPRAADPRAQPLRRRRLPRARDRP